MENISIKTRQQFRRIWALLEEPKQCFIDLNRVACAWTGNQNRFGDYPGRSFGPEHCLSRLPDGGTDVFIYEAVYRCEDCESGNPTHDPYHLPHTTYLFSFNKPATQEDFNRDGDYSSVELIEEWNIDELRSLYDSPIDGPCEWSWTQLAIARCNELEG